METKLRLALLIDGDNAEPELLPQMIDEVSKHGVTSIRRVYGDWSNPKLGKWKEKLIKYGLKAQQQFSYVDHKNATDIALIIDAMEIVYTAEVDGICIASGDSDFTPLAIHVREKNLFMMGIGQKTKTSPAFANACSEFKFTEEMQPVTDTGKKVDTAKPQVPVASANDAKGKVTDDHARRLLQEAFASASKKDGSALLATIGSSLRQMERELGLDIYGQKKLIQLVKSFPDLFVTETRMGPNDGQITFMRLKKN